MHSAKQTSITPQISIAPMIDRTDRHFRYFCRLLTKKSLLYSEMITTYAIVNGNRNKLLDFSPLEKPVALQIAGCSAEEIYEAVRIAEEWEYDEININVGCPSNKVSGNDMGAVLMAYPHLVAEMVSAIKRATQKPVTVKNRIGIDGKNVLPESYGRTLLDTYEDMENFIKIVSTAGTDRFIIHARIAVLAGLSPKENREVPKLRYEDVYQLKKNFPGLSIVINGGIQSTEDIEQHLQHVDGVMIGRAAYDNPYLLTKVDAISANQTAIGISRREIIHRYMEYVEAEEKIGTPSNALLRHIHGLFYDHKGSRIWKHLLSSPYGNQSGTQLLQKALEILPQDVLDQTF